MPSPRSGGGGDSSDPGIADAVEERGVRAWLDERELVPGRPWQEALEHILETCRTVAVLVGADGLGPWEKPEMRVAISQFVKRESPVIPVLLPGAADEPDLPPFLQEFTWVDLRDGLTPARLDKLEWGIIGVKPGASKAAPGPRMPPHNLPFRPLGSLLKGRDDTLRQLAADTSATAIVQQERSPETSTTWRSCFRRRTVSRKRSR